MDKTTTLDSISQVSEAVKKSLTDTVKATQITTTKPVHIAQQLAQSAAANGTPLVISSDKIAILIGNRRRVLSQEALEWLIYSVLTGNKFTSKLPLGAEKLKLYIGQLRHTIYITNKQAA